MTRKERIRLARLRSGLSQRKLSEALGLNRSAVGNWESGLTSPSATNLERLACELKVNHEWLSTGRGEMSLPGHWHDTPVADAELVECEVERRLLEGWRRLPAKARVAVLQLVDAWPATRR